jgi:hypothetical protein
MIVILTASVTTARSYASVQLVIMVVGLYVRRVMLEPSLPFLVLRPRPNVQLVILDIGHLKLLLSVLAVQLERGQTSRVPRRRLIVLHVPLDLGHPFMVLLV